METVFLDLECAANIDIYEFDFLLTKREKELTRQHKQQVVGNSDGDDKIKSRCCYVPPDYDDFMVRKGAEMIRNKRRNMNIHPAYEVFMQWREYELIQKNIQQKEDKVAQKIDGENFNNSQYLNKRERKCLWLYGNSLVQSNWNGTHNERGFIELLKQNNDKNDDKKVVCSPIMKKFQLQFQTEMKEYKEKANALRLMEKKIEIRDDAKSAYKSEEDFIDDHLDTLYRSVHYNPVNYGHVDWSLLHHACEVERKYNKYNGIVLYSSYYCYVKNNGRRLFPDYAKMNEDEEKDIADWYRYCIEYTPWSYTEMFKSTLIINHVNLPIP